MTCFCFFGQAVLDQFVETAVKIPQVSIVKCPSPLCLQVLVETLLDDLEVRIHGGNLLPHFGIRAAGIYGVRVVEDLFHEKAEFRIHLQETQRPGGGNIDSGLPCGACITRYVEPRIMHNGVLCIEHTAHNNRAINRMAMCSASRPYRLYQLSLWLVLLTRQSDFGHKH